MHIVYLTSEYPDFNSAHGGVGTFVKWISMALIERGFNVSVIGIYNIDKVEVTSKNNINFYLLPKSKWPSLKFLDHSYRLNKALKEIEKLHTIDIIEGCELNFAFLKPIRGVKNIIRLHGGHYFFSKENHNKIQYWKLIQEHLSFSKSDFIIAVSHYVKNITSEKYRLPIDTPVIYNSVNSKFDIVNNEVQNFKTKILIFGSICHKKGQDTVLKALNYLDSEVQEKIEVNIIGRKTKETEYYKFLKDLSLYGKYDLIISDHLSQEKLINYIKDIDVIIIPSRSESFGLTLIESFLTGKIVLFRDIDVFNELLIGNFKMNSFSNSKDLYSILKILVEKPSEYKNSSIVKFVKEVFNEQKLIESNINFYKNCLK